MQITIETDRRAVAHTRPNPVTLALVPGLEGHRSWLKGGGLSFEPTEGNLRIWRARYRDELTIDDKRPQEAATEALAAAFDGQPPSVPYEFKTAPYPHQIAALAKMATVKHAALFMEQGTGKSKTAIDRAGQLFRAGEISGVLIVAPKGVHRQWIASQVPQHCGVPFTGAHHPIGTKQWKDRAFLADFGPDPNRLSFFSVNVDAIWRDSGRVPISRFIEAHRGRVLMILDESHKVKNAASKRHKAAVEIGAQCARRIILTGTPIANDLTDEWAQLKFLDERIIGIRYKSAFQNQFCQMGGFEGKQVIGVRNIERFQELTAPYVYRCTRQDIGLLPPAFEDWEFDLTRAQKDALRSLKEDFLAKVRDGEIVTAANGAVAVHKAQQIANGFALDTETGTVFEFFRDPADNPRIAAMLEYLDGDESPAVIWCRFKHDIRMIAGVLGDRCVTYYGDTSSADRDEAVRRFTGGDVPFFVSNPQAGGTGLNLQGACRRDLFYSNSENSVDRWQAEARIDRIGSSGAVVHTDLIAKGSPDRKIKRNLRDKKSLSDLALGDIVSLFEEEMG